MRTTSIAIVCGLVSLCGCSKSEQKREPDVQSPIPLDDKTKTPPKVAPPPRANYTSVPAHTDPPKENGPVHPTQLAVGDNHSCVRMSDDTLRCWGSNDWGQLGNGTVTMTEAVVTPLVTGVVEVSAGYGFTCARLRDHTVSCFGNAQDGEIGVSSSSDNSSIPTPTPVPGLADVVQIDSSTKHSCALHANGTVSCWGDNTYGLLGDGTTTQPPSGAVQVKGLDGVTQLSVGDAVCARRVDGTAWCWGTNMSETAQPVPGLANIAEAAVGGLLECVRDDAGRVTCWGSDDSGQLGPDGTGDGPTMIRGLSGVTSLAASDTHACAIVGKEVLCWGTSWVNPSFPKDCLTDTTHTGGGGGVVQWKYCATPTPVAKITGAIAVDVSQFHACAVTGTGVVWCWGADSQPTKISL